jgi:NAD(P)-dependent dehydrogenase (short-subunit alcohol dehydrogenase family)
MHAPSAILTGAGSGIGQAAAVALAAAGFRLVLVGRRAEALRATAAALPAGAEAIIHPADLTEPGAAAGVIAAAEARFGGVDALINNAGTGDLIPLEKTTPADVERAWRVNTFAPAALILAAWPALARRKGRIINVSSMASFDPFPGFFAYASSKAGVDMLTISAAKEGAAAGIKAFSVNPGAVETPMLRKSFSEQTLPRDQTLKPEDVAGVIVQLAIGSMDDRNGQRVPVLSAAARAWYDQWAPQQRLPGAV